MLGQKLGQRVNQCILLCPDSNSNCINLIFTKLGQQLHLVDIQAKFEYGSCQVKNQVIGSISPFSTAPLCPDSYSNCIHPIFTKLGQQLHLVDIQVKFEYGSCRVKNQVIGSISAFSTAPLCPDSNSNCIHPKLLNNFLSCVKVVWGYKSHSVTKLQFKLNSPNLVRGSIQIIYQSGLIGDMQPINTCNIFMQYFYPVLFCDIFIGFIFFAIFEFFFCLFPKQIHQSSVYHLQWHTNRAYIAPSCGALVHC